VDDGARNVAEALEMARQAVAAGTDTMVATPHRGWFLRRPARPEVVREHVAGLQESLNRAHIPLKIVPGVEIKMAPRVADDLVSGESGTLGDAGHWALIEPPFDRIPAGGLESLRKVIEAGFCIVLAHPERCAEVQQSLAFLEACADLGIAFQLTSGSLLGRFGPRAQETAHAILARTADWPLVIASDTHDLHDRSCALLRDARDAAAALVGEERAQEMVDARPRAMISPA
jgi:protein-tyrosine phosphatase